MTDRGRLRSNNQDSYFCNDKIGVYLVADGLGGHQGGEVASTLARDVVGQIFLAAQGPSDPPTFLTVAVEEANRQIYQKSQSDAYLKGMGTTLTAIYFSNETAYMAHVGDSRVYLIQDKMIWQLSEDHTVVSRQLAVGANAPLKNVLTRSVGFDSCLDIDLYTKKVASGESYLLCSDGLYGMMKDEEIANIVSQCSLEEAPKELIRLANKRGGEDNITVVVVKIEGLN